MAEKTCYFCGSDCNGQPRGKDPQGRYYHTRCLDTHRSEAQRAAPVAAGYGDDASMLASLIDDADLPGSKQCPGCGSGMGAHAVLCTSCGYDTSTGTTAKLAPPTALMPRSSLARTGASNSSWPTVVGIICIIWAIGGIVFHLIDKLGSAMVGVPGEEGSRGGAFVVAGLVIPVLMGIWLLIGGMDVIKRKQSGPSNVKRWAIYRLVLALVCGGVLIAIASSMDTDDELRSRGIDPEYFVTVALITTLIQCIWPVFCIIWFGRKTIRDEVSRW